MTKLKRWYNQYMSSDQKDLQAKAEKIDAVFESGMAKIDEIGEKIIALLKSTLKQAEEKKIEKLSKKLKS